MATEVRERGNALYKQGKLPEAIKCYEEAASLAPGDPSPLSNLSAAKFEMGDYPAAAEFAQKALSLTTHDSPSRDKLYLRLARCYLHRLQTQQAQAALEKCNDMPGKDLIAEFLAVAGGLDKTDTGVQTLRRRVFDRLPRYKPCLQDEPEYYPLGHDIAEPLFDKRLAATSSRNSSLSFLFCGIGDARHLWATLNAIMMHIANGGGKDLPKELHFTLVDLKPASLARILIFLSLLSQLPLTESFGSPASEDATWVMSYLYIGHIVPPFVHGALSRVISDLVRVLEKNSLNREGLLQWVFMSETTRAQVLEHLRLWSRPLDKLYRPENVRKLVGTNIQDTKMRRMMNGLIIKEPTPQTCEEDEATFNEFTITPPPEAFVRRHEPQIKPHLDLAWSTRRSAKEKARGSSAFDEYINQHWKTNMTLIDLEWEAKKERNNDFERPSEFEWTKLTAMDGEPVTLLPHVLGDTAPTPMPGHKGVIDMMAAYFFIVATTLHSIRSRSKLRIEMIAGEMTDTMERLRYGCLDDRAGSGSSVSFLRCFDRVHMSNVPDYVGGILAPLEYARPLLKDIGSSFQYNCLLNPPKFKSQEHFLSEYLLMSSKQEIRDNFGAELFDQYDGQVDTSGDEFYLGDQYWAWKPAGISTELPWGKLMPRARVVRWLYAHFLKICMPAKRDPEDEAAVYAPLNPTAFIRLVLRLAERGYPAHWLGTVIENLTSGVIQTTARAPRKVVMDVKDISETHSPRQMTVAPWVAEFTTLIGIWRGLMPFGFVVANGAHVALADIFEYSVTFPDFNGKRIQLRIPHFILVFYRTDLGKIPHMLRTMLLDDEVGDQSEWAKKARVEGLHVVTTFRYVTDTRTASFWMRQDVADEIRRGNWNVSIWRTDSWKKQVGEVPASENMVKGQPWV